MSDSSRTRTFSWEDPKSGLVSAMGMSGLEYLQAMSRGDLPVPPIFSLMGMEGGEVEKGKVTFLCTPAEYHYNPIGVVHGGFASTLCDSAMACAIHTMLPAGVAYTTLEMKVNFVRPLTVDTGQVRCEGTVIHMGRTVATAEARLIDLNGKLYAHATTTCLIMNPNEGAK